MKLKLSNFMMESRGWFGLSQDSLISAKSIFCSLMKVLNSVTLLYSDRGLTTKTLGRVIAVIKLLFLWMVIRHLGVFAALAELDSDFLLRAEMLRASPSAELPGLEEKVDGSGENPLAEILENY